MSESTRYAVLGLVARRPTYGYALVDQLRHWPKSDGLALPPRSIYKALRALREEQLIEPLDSHLDREPDGPSRRRFGITPEGERRYEQWLRRPPESFGELWLRIGTAREQDLPTLIEIVAEAEHQLMAYYRELRAPDVRTLVKDGAAWSLVLTGLLDTVEYNEVAARTETLHQLRQALEDLRDRRPLKVVPS